MNLIKALLAVAFVALLPSAPAFAATTLTYSDHEPLGGMRTRFIKEVFFSAIEKESNGRLKIDDHWNGQLAGSYDALRAVAKEGGVDMAIVVPEYAPNELPLHQIFKGFPLGPTGDRQIAFFRRVYADIPAFPAELAKENVVNIFFATGYPVAFFSTKPLNDLENIKGSTWRTASFWHRDFLRNAGATPVSMPWGEGVFKALEAGTLDGLVVNVDSGYMLNAHTAAPNVLLSKDLWLGHVYLLAMNKRTWDGLAKEDQEAIQRAAETAYASLGAVMADSFAAQIGDLRKAGAQVRVLSPAELAQWAVAAKYKDVQDAWVKEQEGKGGRETGPALEKVRGIMNDIMK